MGQHTTTQVPQLPILPIQGQQQGNLLPLQPGGPLSLQTNVQQQQTPFVPIPAQTQQQPIQQVGVSVPQVQGAQGGNVASTLGTLGLTGGTAALAAGQPEIALPLYLAGAALTVIGTLFDDSGEKATKESKRQFNENLDFRKEQFEFKKPILTEQARLQTQAARANLGIAGVSLSGQVGGTIGRLAQAQRIRNIRGGRTGV